MAAVRADTGVPSTMKIRGHRWSQIAEQLLMPPSPQSGGFGCILVSKIWAKVDTLWGFLFIFMKCWLQRTVREINWNFGFCNIPEVATHVFIIDTFLHIHTGTFLIFLVPVEGIPACEWHGDSALVLVSLIFVPSQRENHSGQQVHLNCFRSVWPEPSCGLTQPWRNPSPLLTSSCRVFFFFYPHRTK